MFFFIPRNFFDRSDWMPIESEDENLNGVCEESALQVTSLSIGTVASASITSNDETVMMSLNTIDKYCKAKCDCQWQSKLSGSPSISSGCFIGMRLGMRIGVRGKPDTRRFQ